MRLTKKVALDKSIELWEWLAETGKKKGEWPEREKYGQVDAQCFLCESVRGNPDGCSSCSYYQRHEWCQAEGQPYENWRHADTIEGRKEYASEFLAQLKEIRDDDSTE